MTIFSIIWLVVVLWCFSRDDIKYMLFITLLFMTFQCDNVIAIGEISIGPQLLTSMILILKILIDSKWNLYIYDGSERLIIGAGTLLVVAIISSVVNHTFKTQILGIGQLAIYISCFVIIIMSDNMPDNETLYWILRKIIIFLLFVGVVQFMTTTDILPIRSILKVLFYNDTSGSIAFYQHNYFRVMSTFMEPSYFAGLLVGAFYYFLSLQDRWSENLVLLIAIVIELILTFSSTAYGAFAIVGIIFILIQKNIDINYKINIIVFALLAFLVLYIGFYDILDQVIFSKSSTGSYGTRENLNNAALRLYETSPVFGVGYKNARASSIIHSLLAQCGVLGLISYIVFNFILISPIFENYFGTRNVSEFRIGASMSVLTVMICMIIACPDLDLCTYWFWVYVIGIYFRADTVAINKKEGLYMRNDNCSS